MAEYPEPDVINRTVNALRNAHDRCNDTDMEVINLISQLSALKAALKKIGEWISSDLEDLPQHHQFVIDLKDSISCCQALIRTWMINSPC